MLPPVVVSSNSQVSVVGMEGAAVVLLAGRAVALVSCASALGVSKQSPSSPQVKISVSAELWPLFSEQVLVMVRGAL